MTAERFAQLRDLAEEYGSYRSGTVASDALDECLDEIAALRLDLERARADLAMARVLQDVRP